MAEAIVAFSLAANILPFIETAGRFVSALWDVYTNQGANQELLDVSTVEVYRSLANDLKDKGDDIRKALEDCAKDSSIDSDTAAVDRTERISASKMLELAQKCAKVADELLDRLKSLHSVENSRLRNAMGLVSAMLWKKSKIVALENRLKELRDVLSFELLLSMREYTASSIRTQRKALSSLEDLSQDVSVLKQMLGEIMDSDKPLGPSIVEYVSSKVEAEHRGVFAHKLENSLFEMIELDYKDGELQAHQSVGGPSPSQEIMEQWIIDKICFKDMKDREDRVETAHVSTFRWIFDQSQSDNLKWSNFSEWLESQEPLYWITGKPGSGKSTLVKFIAEYKAEGRTPAFMKHLMHSADGAPVSLAWFFAWSSGTEMQMTQQGMCRAIAYQLLSQNRHVIPEQFPALWEMLRLFGKGSWSLFHRDYINMLHSLVGRISEFSKIYITIDGLDEISGDLEELCALISRLVSHKTVKVCVASRPWSEFEDAFGDKPRLLLQDLTRPDILAYVLAKLKKSRYFLQLCSELPDTAEQLLADIVEKSSGVFLWVALVVKSILEGLRDGDRIEELNQRLDDLPSDLDKLFEKILGGLKKSHMFDAKKYFEIMEAHQKVGQLPISILFFADQPCPTYAIGQSIGHRQPNQYNRSVVARRINSRCKGLLEIAKNDYVDYLHRTVADWIKSPQARQILSRETSQPPDVYLLLSAAYLAQIRGLTGAELNEEGNFGCWVTQCLRFAAEVEERSFQSRSLVLDCLDKTGRALAERIAFDEGYDDQQRLFLQHGHWVLDCPPVLDHKSISVDAQYFFGRTFLSLIIRFGIMDYVRVRAQRGCLVQRVGNYWEEGGIGTSVWPLLLDLLYGYRGKALPMSLLRELLAHGADPRFKPRWENVATECPLTYAEEQRYDNKEEVLTELERPRPQGV